MAKFNHAELPEVPGLGLVVYDGQGTIIRSDDQFCRAMDRPAGELIGSSYWALTAPGQKQRELNQLLSGPEPFEKEFLGPDQQPFSARVHGGKTTASDGGEAYFAYVYRLPEESDDVRAATDRALRHQNAILLDLNRNESIDRGDLDAALKAITEAGTAGLRCERSSVWLYADNETKIVCLDLFQKTEQQHAGGVELFAKDFPGYFQALAEDRTIAANDAHTHPATREFSEVYLAPLGITSMLEAPIRKHGKLLGVLCSEHVGPMRTFTQEEQNFSANVADFVTRALQANERQKYEDALKETNANLEKLVTKRTASLQLVLDSMGDGLVVANLDGTLEKERSATTTEWFGTPEETATVAQYLAGDDADFKERFQMGFDEVIEDIMPFEVTAHQMPQNLTRGGRTYRLQYRQVMEEGAFARVVIIISDITEELVRQKAEQRARELPEIVGHLVKDREGFQAFVHETESLLRELAVSNTTAEEQARRLHTLKGNTAIQGFATLSHRVHEIEDLVAEQGMQAITIALVDDLSAMFRESLAPLAALIEGGNSELIQLLPDEHRALLDGLEETMGHQQLLDMVRSWSHDRTDALLSPLVNQGRRLAQRLHKEIDVEVAADEFRVPDPGFRNFFGSIVHVFRNAIDHGIESPEERTASGKSPTGTVQVKVYRENGQFVVAVSDDGRGIDWARVRAKAAAAGLPAGSQIELEQLIFTDGFTTRDEITTLSGRGVGLAATRQACDALNGRCTVETTPGKGTTFRFSFPVDAVKVAAA